MSVIIAEAGITVPGSVVDLESFNQWVDSPEFPEKARISYIHGNVIVDTSMEQLFTHNRLKVRITTALDVLVVALGMGYVFGDRVALQNEAADLSVEPDVLFVSFASIEAGRAILTQGTEDGYVRVDGSADLVVEIVSTSSENKDRVELREAYYEAGVSEYWLLDGRDEPVSFEILKRTTRGFSSVRPQSGGWMKSTVFNKSFRIAQSSDKLGNPKYTLESRD